MRILVCAGVCVLGLAIGVQTASAQTSEQATVGVKVGVTWSTLSATGLAGFDPQSKAGFLGGAWLNVGGKIVRVQPELLVTTRQFSSPSPSGSIDVSTRVTEVPVLVVIRMRPDNKAHPLLFAGPYIGVLNKATQTIGSTKTDLDSQLKNTDMGVVVGAGAEIAAKRGAIVFEARYVLGLRNVSETSGVTFKSRSLMASFGYRF